MIRQLEKYFFNQLIRVENFFQSVEFNTKNAYETTSRQFL